MADRFMIQYHLVIRVPQTINNPQEIMLASNIQNNKGSRQFSLSIISFFQKNRQAVSQYDRSNSCSQHNLQFGFLCALQRVELAYAPNRPESV